MWQIAQLYNAATVQIAKLEISYVIIKSINTYFGSLWNKLEYGQPPQSRLFIGHTTGLLQPLGVVHWSLIHCFITVYAGLKVFN